MRQLRRHRWFAFLGLAALAIQFAAAFGHHHDHAAHSLDTQDHERNERVAHFIALVGHRSDDEIAGWLDRAGDHRHHNHHGPHKHSDEDLCAICWSIATLASLAIPEIAQLPFHLKARLPKILPPETSGSYLRIGRAHWPRGPPVRSC